MPIRQVAVRRAGLSAEEKQADHYRSVKQLHAQFHEAASAVSAVWNLGPEGGGGERDEPRQRIHPSLVGIDGCSEQLERGRLNPLED